MNNNREYTTISLELLLLNDLLRTEAIDRDIFDQASKKILSIEKLRTETQKPSMPVSA